TLTVRARDVKNDHAVLAVKDDVHCAGTVNLEADTPDFATIAALAVQPQKTFTLDAGGVLNAQDSGQGAALLEGDVASAGTITVASSTTYYQSYAGLSVQNGVLTNVEGGEITFTGGPGLLNADIHNGGKIVAQSSAQIGHGGGPEQNVNEGFIQVLNNSA